MIIPEKKIFEKEVLEIEDKQIQSMLMLLYDHLLGKKSIPNSKTFCKEVLSKLYQPSKFTTEVLIPLSFHNTTIAKVIFSIMYGIEEKLYTVNDIIELTKSESKTKGFSKQYIKQEMDSGNLKGEKKNGYWSFTESEVIEYLKLKGIK